MTTILSPELKKKIDPLLRLQASDNDHERSTASAAIGRLLKGAGNDWHDLVDALLGGPSSQPPNRPQASVRQRSRGAVELPRGELLKLLGLIEQRMPFLSPRSHDFVASLRSHTWQQKVRLSEKQWHWLQSLVQQTGV